MRLEAPTLDIDDVATESLIAEVISSLPGKENPYAILGSDELTYMQTVWGEDGFWLEHQTGSVDEHYMTVEEISVDEAVLAFCEYLRGSEAWKSRFNFSRKDVRGFWGRLGYAVGSFLGSLLRGYKSSRSGN